MIPPVNLRLLRRARRESKRVCCLAARRHLLSFLSMTFNGKKRRSRTLSDPHELPPNRATPQSYSLPARTLSVPVLPLSRICSIPCCLFVPRPSLRPSPCPSREIDTDRWAPFPSSTRGAGWTSTPLILPGRGCNTSTRSCNWTHRFGGATTRSMIRLGRVARQLPHRKLSGNRNHPATAPGPTRYPVAFTS